MSPEPLPWKILTLFVTLLTIAVPAYVAYDVYYRGPDSEKQITLMNFSPIDPLADLSMFKDKSTLFVAAKGETFNNFVIAAALFQNMGQAPVLPDDYDQNLSVSVNIPWKIITVENGGTAIGRIRIDPSVDQAVELNWRRVSDTRFEADPALLNPGDSFSALVYLTNTEFANTAASMYASGPIVKWDARIVNLPGFSIAPPVYETISQYFIGIGIVIFLSGWAVPFTIAVAILFQVVHLHLLDRSGLIRDWSWKSIGLVVCTGLLSVAAAECIATYVYGTPWEALQGAGAEDWLNAPPIILNAMFLAFLWWKARARAEEPRLMAG